MLKYDGLLEMLWKNTAGTRDFDEKLRQLNKSYMDLEAQRKKRALLYED